ncbi:phosphatidylinositol-3,5-bisphosphate 3-phosphatase MTMR6 [Rhinophrynus dorsalis]
MAVSGFVSRTGGVVVRHMELEGPNLALLRQRDGVHLSPIGQYIFNVGLQEGIEKDLAVVELVKLLDRFSPSNKSTSGTLYLTATHLLFIDSQQREIWILHHHIAAVEKLALTTTGCPLVIQCKNFRVVHFIIPKERDCHDIYNSLLQLSKPGRYEDLYAFSYNPKQKESEGVLGWQHIDLKEEYQRMGVPNAHWQLSDVNRDYKVCETYPRELYVPITASKPIIVGSSKFRSKGRFPVLSYYHHGKQAAICRCSQPLSGFSARCLEDEHMLQSISKANPVCRSMYVMDTRPKLNAMANRAAGKGYENADNYSNIKFQFVGIENIHVMRSSLQKLLEVSGTKAVSANEFFSGLENSGWLRHIKAVLDASVCLAKAIHDENASVLVHCSDGWDRTSQVCSLGSLLLDSFYRTIKGFMVLIEKDWIAFGHKFSDRCGQLDSDSKETSPVFTQFLECVWQLTEQFPRAFEFNEAFLLQIHEHVHSCQFGNFLGNCQKEREELRLKEKTHSLWAYLLAEESKYRNPVFDKNSLKTIPVLEPNTIHFNFKFWRNLYHQFDLSMHPRQSVPSLLLKTMDENKALEEELKRLRVKIRNLKKEEDNASNESICSTPEESPKFKESPCFEKEQSFHPVSDTIRTIEGSNTADNRYAEYAEEVSKAEPSVVSFEFGVAKMTVS